MKKLIIAVGSLFLLSISSLWSQCDIDACAADVTVEACDETDPNIQNDTGFSHDESGALISYSLFENAVSINSDCLDDPNFEYFYIDSPVTDLGGCPHTEFTRTFYIEELGSQVATCDQVITLEDTFTPTIDCPNGGNTVFNIDNFDPCDDSSGEIAANTGYAFSTTDVVLPDPEDFVNVAGGSYDDDGCMIVEASYVDVDDGIACPNAGQIGFQFTRTWTITDVCGNSVSCDEIIQLVDTEGPNLIDGADFFIFQDPNAFVYIDVDCPIILSWTEPTVANFENNCGTQIVVTQTSGPAPGDDFDGNSSVCYIFRDECGNVSDEVCFDILITCFQCMGTGVPNEDCNVEPTCNIGEANGFQSCTPDYVPGSGSTGSLCGDGGIHNASYFSFVAGSESIDITVSASGCTPGDGGQLGIQANVTDICNAGNCYGDSGAACETGDLDFTASGLTIGNIYQLVVDGCAGSVCNYSISLDSDQAFSIPDPEDAAIEILTATSSCSQEPDAIVLCPGSQVQFYPQNFEDAEFFFCWSVDNSAGVTVDNNDDNCPIPDGADPFTCSSDFSTCGPLELTFSQVGSYVVCLDEMGNGCDEQQPVDYCFNVEIVNADDVIHDPINICGDQLGTSFSLPEGPDGEEWGQGSNSAALVQGTNMFTVGDDCGCSYNQFIDVNFMMNDDDVSVEEVFICVDDLGDWINLGQSFEDIEEFFDATTGVATNVVSPMGSDQVDYNGENCDSIITYQFFIYEITGAIQQAAGAGCDVSLTFNNTSAPFILEDDFEYSWTYAGVPAGNGAAISVGEAGTAELTISYVLDNTTCTASFNLAVVPMGGGDPDPPVFSIAPLSVCDGDFPVTFAVPTSASIDYDWNFINGTAPSGVGDQIMVTPIDPTMPVTITVNASSACGSSSAMTTLTIQDAPVVSLPVVADVCVGQMAMLTSMVDLGSAASYTWSVTDPTATWDMPGSANQGTIGVSWNTPGLQAYSLQIMDALGCTSTLIEGTVNVIEALAPPTGFNCVESSTGVTLTWMDNPAGVGTSISVNGAPAEMNATGMIVVPGATGDIINFNLVTLGGTHPCGDSTPAMTSCMVTDCPLNPALMSPLNDICLDGTVMPFQITETNGNPGGVFSGNGVDANGMFDPSLAMPGVNVITYEVVDNVAACTAAATIDITVFENTAENFTIPKDTLCLNEIVSINFDNTAGFMYSWDFGMGNNTPNTATPNFDLSYTTSGDKIISMTIVNGTCSETFEIPVYVRPPIGTPTVLCGALTTNSVEFTWMPVPGVDEYEVTVSTAGNPDQVTTETLTSIDLTGLAEGDMATVSVVAIDPNGCANSVADAETCEAQACPVFTVNLTSSSTLECFDPINGVTINLTAEVLDEDGNPAIGTGMWIGDDIDPVSGVLTPQAVGDYIITYSFSAADGNCPGSNVETITIVDSPTSAFSVEDNSICIGEELIFTYDDTYDSNAIFNWDSSADPTDYNITDNGDGTFTVVFTAGNDSVDFTLQTMVGLCESTTTTQSFMVVSPLEFMLVDLDECYLTEEEIQLTATDTNGDPVDGTWVGAEVTEDGIFSTTENDVTITVSFEEGNCGVSEDMDITLIDQPSLMIDVLTPNLCIVGGQPVTAEVTIETDFFDELVHDVDPPLTGLVPNFTLEFDTPGVYIYTSTVDRPGDCDSAEITWSITVEEEPTLPVITCVSDLNSVSFEWDQVPCAGEYTILINDQIQPAQSENTITVDNLAEGTQVDIIVNIESVCDCDFPDALSLTCFAQACEDADIAFGSELEASYCVSAMTAPFQMTAIPTGVDIMGTGVFVWSGDAVDATGMVDLSGLAVGNYTINVVYTEMGCSYENMISFEITDGPNVVIEIEEAPCDDNPIGNVSIMVDGMGVYDISTNGEMLVEGSNDLEVGVYDIIVQDDMGCMFSESITVGQAPEPSLIVNGPNFIFTDSTGVFSFDLGTNDLQSVEWSVDNTVVATIDCLTGDCGSFNYIPTSEADYEICVTAFYGNGCTVTNCKTFNSEILRIFSIFIPNIVTPEGEGTNSILNMYVEGYDLTVKDFRIFDRWGNLVHRSDFAVEPVVQNEGIVQLWDGNFRDNAQLVPGVYVYQVELLYDEDGRTEYMVGDLTIYR